MTAPRYNGADWLRFAAVALLLVEGGIHLQQQQGVLHTVPTIDTLFVLNAISAAAIALVLSATRGQIATLAALSGIGMTIGALVSLAITRSGTLFNYSEPMLRTAVGLAAVVELGVVLTLSAFVFARLRATAPA